MAFQYSRRACETHQRLQNRPRLTADVAVIPAGEQWRESTLRPCLEDLLGAGSVLAELPGTSSPEAEVAIAAFARFRQDLAGTLFRCGSGKELVEKGFPADVELAGEYAVSSVAPVLTEERFTDGAPRTV
jgi:2-phosphosulfolactate phosphatase